MPDATDQTAKSRFRRGVEITNQLLQILALLVAGAWALWTWNQTTAPSLTTGLQLSADVKTTWSHLSKACVAELSVTVENVGQRKLSVAKAVYIVAKAKPERLAKAERVRIIGSLPTSAEKIAEGEFEPKFLVQEYPPKARANQQLALLVHPAEEQELWFNVELFDSADKPVGYWFGAIEPCQKEEPAKRAR